MTALTRFRLIVTSRYAIMVALAVLLFIWFMGLVVCVGLITHAHAEEIEFENGVDLAYCLEFDESLRLSTARYLENNKEYLDWFREYEKEFNKRFEQYLIVCKCGCSFHPIADRATYRSEVAHWDWDTTCPCCKTKYEAQFDEDRFCNYGVGFTYEEKEAFCDDKNCTWRYIGRHDYFGK
jgi:hypothetical protein